MQFLVGLLEYLIKFIIYGIVIFLAIITGKKLRQAKDAKAGK